MTHYEMAEKLSEKLGVSMEEATEALEACEWEMLDAALLLEKEHGTAQQKTYSTRDGIDEEKQEQKTAGEKRRNVVRALGAVLKSILDFGNRNRFEVRKDDRVVMEMPVTVLVLLVIFLVWVSVPLLIIGLFANYRYSFSGAELGRESVNSAMDKAAEVAEKVKEEVTGDH
ncbi:MAG: DUF4342 domain-containing protein [Clostridia bacterium]|nr:DUF4342 domain-containing protein [Clostridia bacterium]